MREKLQWIPKILLLLLTFLLPLKFGSSALIPEMPMTYWKEPIAIVVASWPVLLFPLAAAAVLVLCILFLPEPKLPVKELRLYGVLWILTGVVSLTGWIHSTTWDFAAQNTAHLLGILCWTLALIRTLETDRDFVRCLTGAMFAGLAVSVYSAFNQYFTGFEETLQYVKNQEARSGMSLLEGQFGSRLKEFRVSGDFSICNSYAGYLVLAFPLLLGGLWRLGGRVNPPLPAKLILTLPCLGVFLFLLKETGSRGGVLALLAGGILILPCLRLERKWKILFWSMIPVGLAGFWLLVRLGRGFNSMLIRFDYFQAAVRMMLLHPFSGAGWGEFLNDYLILKNVVNDEAPHSPHNLILTLGSQCGIPVFLLSALLLALPLAAAMVILYRKCRKESIGDSVSEAAAVWGLGGWTVHSMLELNYETTGSLALAVVVSAMILTGSRLTIMERIPDRLTGSRAARLIFLALCAGAAGCALLYVPGVVRAEMNYDVLHSMTDPRFVSNPQKRWPTETVRDALAKCDPRSPFPYASVSVYFLSHGPYYLENAMEMLDKAIALTPKRSAYHYRKYRILRNFPSRKVEAEAALQKARELSPKNPQYYPDGITPYGKRSY